METNSFKRPVDLLVAVFLLLLFSPFFLLVPVIIKITSPGGPIFYKQKRAGLNGREFDIFKFRSMVPNADQIIKENKELWQKFVAADWKLDMKDDPRITKFGAFMRTFTIDEFPQIWNVFRGEMSIVGPRAYRPQEIKEQLVKYPQAKKDMKDVLKVKPGVTGPWQTSGRNEIPFLQRVKMDAAYARNHSFLGDLKIMLKTPRAMLSKW